MIFRELHTIYPIGDRFQILYEAKSAFAYFQDYRINLITGEKTFVPLGQWFHELSKRTFDSAQKKRVTHLFYELGELIELKSFSNELLAIDIEYKRELVVKEFSPIKKTLKLNEISSVSRPRYKKAFDRVQESLQRGDCYQINLTFPSIYRFSDYKVEEFYSSLWKKKESRAPYAHATFIPLWNKLYLSNSPECLFQARLNKQKLSLWSMPIKGSLKSEGAVTDEQWRKLSSCQKNQGELYMITDLIRNDLSRISSPYSKVIKKKAPLKVPNILHQYSLIAVELDTKTSLLDVVVALFPGGSITGAPKKKVVSLIKDIEGEKRGFYTGSTIIQNGSLQAASINIRSSEICFNSKTLIYSAGGGITLRSDLNGEYDEMDLKKYSFINTLSGLI